MMEISFSWTDSSTGEQRSVESTTDSRSLLHDLVDEYIDRAGEHNRSDLHVGITNQEPDRSSSDDVEE